MLKINSRMGWAAACLATLSVSGCSSLPRGSSGTDASEVFAKLCSKPAATTGVRGSIWMKAKSKEASGQFPANVQVSDTAGLRMEVTQLMGARAALIEIRGTDFKVETPQQGSVSKKAKSWGGIPLEWATSLFMDRVPCPEGSGWSWTFNPEQELVGTRGSGPEQWKYKVVERMGRPFVEGVRLEKSEQQSFELRREDPDPSDGWARRWEIKSAVGEVKVRWRDRKAL